MSILDRLGDVIRSYLNDDDEDILGRTSRTRPYDNDPDVKAAFQELNDYLGREEHHRASQDDFTGYTRQKYSRTAYTRTNNSREDSHGFQDRVPESIGNDFAELGLPLGASAEECKAAYKKLLKIHHPDRHAGHPGDLKKATEKTARINAAYDRIEKWREADQMA
ncbi:MAG: J domain-containing protein [Treponema sp.]|jgi:hypothetical protein|nr:J domain-containing protein [Treponema sp.]